MSFNINYTDDYVYSFTSKAVIGKRVVIVGCNSNFDIDGDAIINLDKPDSTTYDYKPIDVSTINKVVNLFGEDNDLLHAYNSIGYSGVTTVTIMNIPYKPLESRDSSLAPKKDREQFKENMIDAIQTLFEKADFDICVLTSVNVQDDSDIIIDILNDTSINNATRLMIVKAKKPNVGQDINEWNNILQSSIDNIVSNGSLNLSNVCVIADNACYNPNIISTYQGSVDYDNLDVASYIAGLTIAAELKHPSLSSTIFNDTICAVTKTIVIDGVNTQINDERVSCFRRNSIRGVILSNFSTLQRGINSKIALYSAINIYRVSVIIGDLTQQLLPLVGSPMSYRNSNNSSLYVQNAISKALNKYISLDVLSAYSYKTTQDTLKMTTSIYLDLTLVYDLEKVSILNTIGVAI